MSQLPTPTPLAAPAPAPKPARRPTILGYADFAQVIPGTTDFAPLAAVLETHLAWGVDEIFIRCYGGLIGGQIHFDAWWRNELDQTNFLAALAPFAGKLILYGGSLHYLKNLPLLDAWRYMQHVAYPARVLNAQMYFDASSDLAEGSVELQVLHLLKQSGVKVGVEAWPGASSAVTRENWCIAEDFRQTVQGQIDANNGQANWAQPLAQLPGRRISLFASTPAGYDPGDPCGWYRACIPLAFAKGFDVAASIGVFIGSGVTRASLAAAA